MPDSEEPRELGSAIGPDEAELPDDPPDLDELDPFETEADEFEDINEFVSAEWKESTTARGRVRDIIYRAVTPMTAPEVAELAEVSPPTARTELSDLAEEGVVLAESSQNGTVYRRDSDWYRLKRVHRLAGKPQPALESVLRRIEQEIREYKQTYGAESPEDLILEREEMGNEAWQDLSEWRTALVDRHYIRTALQFRRLQRAEASDFDLDPHIPDSDRDERDVVEP